jgi:hypothetical protein
VLLALFLLGGLANTSKSEAVLPAYLIGIVLAPVFLADRELMNPVRVITGSRGLAGLRSRRSKRALVVRVIAEVCFGGAP